LELDGERATALARECSFVADRRNVSRRLDLRLGLLNRIKETQLALYADRTSTATMRANQLRLWFASRALLCALWRIGLTHPHYRSGATR
jgi:hypothetical protein